MSHQDSILQADHQSGLSPGEHHSRWSYRQSLSGDPLLGRKVYHGILDPASNFQTNTFRPDCCDRSHGILDKDCEATGLAHPLYAEMGTSPEQQGLYKRPSVNPRLSRSFSRETASYDLHNVPVASTENISPGTRPNQQPNRRSEQFNQSYSKLPQSPSNPTPAQPLPRNPSFPHVASRHESSYLGDSFEQRRRKSESSDDTDTREGCFATQGSRHTGESSYSKLPYRTRCPSKQARQELHRCALAAAALQLERSKLRREWKKLHREQEILLYGQRRLHQEWQNWKGKHQHHSYSNNYSESMDASNEIETSSESDDAEPLPHRSRHRRAEDLCDDGFRPSTASEQTSHDPRILLNKYNQQWSALPSGSSTDIPWPTADLKAATLNKPHLGTQKVLNSANPQDLLKWNAFNFFTSAFSSRATLKQTANGISMNISATSLEVVKEIRNQAREDIRRWHQDKLGSRGVELAGDERAKAVFAAVYELYVVCSERIRTA